jgi:DNA repair protein RecN (Recombination protein N)
MLRELRIDHLILVEKATIGFQPGFNVLTGETGSGKSAIMGALRLVAGERADPGLIRHGADKGVVEALFDMERASPLSDILEQAGIQWDEAGLVIRREIGARSRAFVNNQVATLHLLRSLQPYLFHLVDQHATHALLSKETHRSLLDLYGECQVLVQGFRAALTEQRRLESLLRELKGSAAARLRELEVCGREVEELEEANLQEGEEEELFVDFSRLSNAETLTGVSTQLLRVLSDGCLSQMQRGRGALAQLVDLDPSQEETGKAVESLTLEMEELVYTLRNYRNNINHNPDRLAQLDDRLALINRMKRKYGATIGEIEGYYERQKNRLQDLLEADEQIDQIEESVRLSRENTEASASLLTSARQAAAVALEQKLTSEIAPLNMEQARMRIVIAPTPRTLNGDDEVTFQLAPNKGEGFVSLGQGVSGGEMARIMLGLKTLLAGKEKVGTLIFDELDANIGGETASVVGQKLTAIAREHQLLCITHFAQVAASAGHHLQIRKEEQRGRTHTLVQALTTEQRKLELTRMLGGIGFCRAAPSFAEEVV